MVFIDFDFLLSRARTHTQTNHREKKVHSEKLWRLRHFCSILKSTSKRSTYDEKKVTSEHSYIMRMHMHIGIMGSYIDAWCFYSCSTVFFFSSSRLNVRAVFISSVFFQFRDLILWPPAVFGWLMYASSDSLLIFYGEIFSIHYRYKSLMEI